MRPTRLFAFRLAAYLGIPDVDAMMESMSSRLLSEWVAFFQISPMPDPWAQSSIQAMLTYNLFSSKGPRKEPADFMPPVNDQIGNQKHKKQSTKEHKDVMSRFIKK